MMKIFFAILPFALFYMSCIAPVKQQLFRADTLSIDPNAPLTALFIPLASVASDYFDNTTLLPKIELSDSFYCEAANNLILYEGTKRFTIKSVYQYTLQDTLTRWSSFEGDTTGKCSVSTLIRELTDKNGSEYALVAFACSLKHSVTRQEGWRDGKYGETYERPVAYSAKVMVHVQVWNKGGVLLYENKALGYSGRPILYDTLKKRTNKNDVVSYSKNLFSPPLLRALNKAVRGSMSLRF